MQQKELHTGAPRYSEMFFGGPQGSTSARAVSIAKGKLSERHVVETRSRAGVLASRTGSGKTSIIIELLARPEAPSNNPTVRHSCLGQVLLRQKYLPIDFVVVPFKLMSQWSDELKILEQYDEWCLISSRVHLNEFVGVLENWLDERSESLPAHVLLTDSMYKLLLEERFKLPARRVMVFGLGGKRKQSSCNRTMAKRAQYEGQDENEQEGDNVNENEVNENIDDEKSDEEDDERDDDYYDDDEAKEAKEAKDPTMEFDYCSFPYMFRVRRVIVDECDSLNFKMLWANFIWFVSATFKTFIRNGGACKSTHSLLGELKKATYYYTFAQLKELFLLSVSRAAFERALPKGGLPPFKSKSIVYEMPPPATFDIDAAGHWARAKEILFAMCGRVRPGSLVLAFYQTKDVQLEKQMQADLEEQMLDEGVEYVLVNNSKCFVSERIQQLLHGERTNCRTVLLMNARFLADGLNLQVADYAVIIGFMSERLIRQVIGRVQRPIRHSQLSVLRIWCPDERLLFAPFKGRFDSAYADVKKLMSAPKWTIETDLEILKIYENQSVEQKYQMLRRMGQLE